MQLEERLQAMVQLHLSYQQCYCLLRFDIYQKFDGTFRILMIPADITLIHQGFVIGAGGIIRLRSRHIEQKLSKKTYNLVVGQNSNLVDQPRLA